MKRKKGAIGPKFLRFRDVPQGETFDDLLGNIYEAVEDEHAASTSVDTEHLVTPLCGVTHPQALCAGRGWRSPHHGKEPLAIYRYNRPHFLRRRDSAWKRHRDKTCAIEQGMRRPSATHRPGAPGMRDLAPRSGEKRDTAERCHEGVSALSQGIPLRFIRATVRRRLVR